jgi:hypothetical protein
MTVFEGLVTGKIWMVLHSGDYPPEKLVDGYEEHEMAAIAALPTAGGVN